MMKKLLILIVAISTLENGYGQALKTISIEESYRLATEHYPMTRQRELIALSEDYSISNAAKGIFPTVSINGQESYQSDVTQVPIRSPEIEPLSKHQYKVYGEVAANLYDGGVIKNQKLAYRATSKIDEQKLEVELYKLKDRINQLFFGVLLMDAQLDQNRLLADDIGRGITQAEAAIANGVALKSSADVLRVELLRTRQKEIELKSARVAFIDMLGLMTGQSLSETTVFEKPESVVASSEIIRPELLLYDYQRQAIDVQNRMLTTRNRPKLSAFFQGGYGRPALNMLNNQADTYYITGLRLQWTISGFYTYKKEKALLDISRNNIELQKRTFLYHTDLTLKNYQGEINRVRDVLASDDEIIRLREEIKNTAQAQLGNGVINSNDYFREVTAADQAHQAKILHEIQLLLAQYNLQNTAGA